MSLAQQKVVVLAYPGYQELDFWYPSAAQPRGGRDRPHRGRRRGAESILGYPVIPDTVAADLDPASVSVIIAPGVAPWDLPQPSGAQVALVSGRARGRWPRRLRRQRRVRRRPGPRRPTSRGRAGHLRRRDQRPHRVLRHHPQRSLIRWKSSGPFWATYHRRRPAGSSPEHLLYGYPGAELDHRTVLDYENNVAFIAKQVADGMNDWGFGTLGRHDPAGGRPPPRADGRGRPPDRHERHRDHRLLPRADGRALLLAPPDRSRS